MTLEGLSAERIWLRQAARDVQGSLVLLGDLPLSDLAVWRDAAASLADLGLQTLTAEMLWDTLSAQQRQAREEAGQGFEWLEALLRDAPTPDEWTWAQRQLSARHSRRVLERAVDRAYELLRGGGDLGPVMTLLSEAVAQAQGDGETPILRGEDMAAAAALIVEEFYAGGGKWRTGIAEIDLLTDGGFSPGQLIVVGAHPSHGKSLVSHALAEGLSEHNDTHAFLFDCEMGERTTLLRQLERLHGGKPLKLPTFQLALQTLAPTLHRVAESRVMVGTPRDVSLAAAVRQSLLAVNYGCRVIVWDGATLLRVPGKGSIREELLEVTRTAKAFARKHGVVVILTGQLLQERLPQDGRLIRPPGRADFKESKSFVEDADYLFLVRRVDKWQCIGDRELYGVEDPAQLRDDRGLTWVRLAKDRHGDKEDEIATLNLMTPGLRFRQETLPAPTLAVRA